MRTQRIVQLYQYEPALLLVAGPFDVFTNQRASQAMKKLFWIILVLAALTICAWLALRPPAQVSSQNTAPPELPQPTNTATPTTSNPSPKPPQPTTNVFVRPNYIDEDHWNQLMLVRQLALSQNQPVEFYARVLDQNNQPVEGAKLTLKLTRTDETMFATTNFFSRKMGDEVLIIPFELFSDSNGWIQLTETNGSFLDLTGLSKEGYLSSYPDGNFAGVHYELGGIRTPTQDILMTNSWNPEQGYILHLDKK